MKARDARRKKIGYQRKNALGSPGRLTSDDISGARRLSPNQQLIVNYEIQQLEKDVYGRPVAEQAEIVNVFATLMQDLLGTWFADVDIKQEIFDIWERGKPLIDKVARNATKLILGLAQDLIKTVLNALFEILKDIIPKLVTLALNVIAEAIKYLLFGLIGGPWSTLIPLVLNVLGPVISTIDELDDEFFDQLKAGWEGSSEKVSAGADRYVRKGVGGFQKLWQNVRG